MNEKPESFWRKEWKLSRPVTALLLLATVAVFLGTLISLAILYLDGELRMKTGQALFAGLHVVWLAAVVFLFAGVRRSLFDLRMIRRGLFTLVCFITFVVLFYAEENWRGARAWENYRRAEEAKGEKFDRQDFIPAIVPDDQNFAMTPYLAPLLDFKPGTQEHPSTNWIQQFENFKQKVGNLDLKASEQARSNSWVRSQRDLPAWYAAFLRDRDKNINDLTLTNATPRELATKVLAVMAAANPVLDEIRAASRRPHSRFNIHYENDDPAAVLLPHLAVLKHLTLVLELRASAELTLGRNDDAIADINLMFYLTEASRNEPILVSQLVRFTQLQMVLQPIAQGLEAHQWSDAQLQIFQQRLQSFDLCADTKHAMNAERAFFGGGVLDYFRDLSSSERVRYFEAIGQWPESSGVHSSLPVFYVGMAPKGWYYLEQLSYDQTYQAYLSPVIDVENHHISPGLARKMHEQFELMRSPVRAYTQHRIFSALLLPALPGVAEKAARAQTAADVTAIACALERFHLANGKYPPALDALVPQFLPKLPHDVISGEPYHYRLVDENQFVLYSVGWNEKDDGGTVGSDKDRKVDWDNGDWVWGYPATK